jgi:Protein of unknown function (DUF1573)
MKFWLTVVVGVVVVAAGSTALMVLSPTTTPTPAPETVAVDPEKQPVAEIVGPQEASHQNLGQQQSGQDVFKIRNGSKTAPLVLTPMKPTCQCTDMYLSDREPSHSEKVPDLAHQRADYTVKPGETVYVVARWNTKDKLGKQQVTVPVGTNDRRKYEIAFRISLDIHKEIVQSTEQLQFGLINEGQIRTASATVTSLIRDKLAIEKIETMTKGITAKAAPLSPEELKTAGAKSGYRIIVENTGKNPVGALDDVVAVSLKTGAAAAQLVRFGVSGQVVGDVVTDPAESTIDFKEVTAGTYRPKVVKVFARALNDSDVLRVGTVKPAEVLAATMERIPKINKGWNLSVAIKPNAPGGTINDGSISIVDSTGRERLVLKVTGLVDPSFTRTAAR